jgi:membrane associated rhomboid family serine protease
MAESPEPAHATIENDAPARPLTWLAAVAVRLSSAGGGRWEIEVLEPDLVVLFAGGARVALIQYSRLEPRRWQTQLARIENAVSGQVHGVLLGGPAALRLELEQWSERLVARRWRLSHVCESAPLWQSRERRWSFRARQRDRSLLPVLLTAAPEPFTSPAQALDSSRRLEAAHADWRRELSQLDRFRELMAAARPRVTLAILAVLALVYGLQLWWGGGDLPPLLAHMGSMAPERARSGEWWRFFACTFLHGGPLHLALNALVLYMVGRFLEPILGPARFLLLYLGSGLAGSVASSFFVTSQSVGASGAIWGLLGTEIVLAFHPRRLLPSAFTSVARRTAVANLALNFVNSFNPHVDLAAHVGGGLMGALLCWILVSRGQPITALPRSAEAGWIVRGSGCLLAMAFACALVAAQIQGRPWRLKHFPELGRVALPSGATLLVPEALPPRLPTGAADKIGFGDLAYDPHTVDISWMSVSRGVEEGDVRRQLTSLERAWSVSNADFEVLLPPRLVQDGSRLWVSVRQRSSANPDVSFDRVVGVGNGVLLRVDVVAWDDLASASEGLAARIFSSYEGRGPRTRD